MIPIAKPLLGEEEISVVHRVIESGSDFRSTPVDDFSFPCDDRLALLNEVYQKYHTRCFWSYRKEHELSLSDMDWVKQKLLKYGGRTVLLDYQKLCR